MNRIFKIGILNTANGKVVKEVIIKDTIYTWEKELLVKKVLDSAEKVSRWFDDKDTFFSGKKLWEHWKALGMMENRIKALVSGESLGNLVCESISVFPKDGGRGVGYEFYVERIDERR